MGNCPRCESKELIFLFQEERYTPDGTWQHTWEYLECCECSLVFMEHVQSSKPKVNENENTS